MVVSRGRRRRLGLVALALAASLWTSVPSAAQPAGEWSGGAPLPEPRRLLAAAAEDGRLYAFGGCGSPCFSPPQHIAVDEETRVEVYDPGADRWQRRRPMPYVFFGGAAAAPGDGFVYTVGGAFSPGVVERYDPAADAWSRRAPLPTPRHGLAAATIDGLIYVVGGSDGRRASGALEIYDPSADAWTRGPPLPTPRAQLAAAAVGGRLFAIGGSPDCCGGAASAAVEVFDPATGAWSAVAPLPSPRQVGAAAAVDDRLFVFGGFVPGAGVLAETLEYDPRLDRWTRLADLPTPRDQATVAVLGGSALVVGGSVDCHCRALDTVERFRPPPVPSAAVDLACTLAAPATASAGDRVVYALIVTNGGPDEAAGSLVTARLPAQVTGRRWTCRASGGAACPAAGRGELNELVDLPPGGSVRFELTATVTAAASCPVPSVLAATARASAPSGVDELRPADDACAAVTGYAPQADLAVALAPAPVDGQEEEPPVTIVATVDNLGPDAACGATLTATLPPAFAAPVWTCSAPGPCSPPAGAAPGVFDLPPGATAELTVTAAVFAEVADCPLRVAVVVATPPGTVDPDPENDRAVAVLDDPVCPSPVVAIPALGGSGRLLLIALLGLLAVLSLRGRGRERGWR